LSIGGDPAVMALINKTPLPNNFTSIGDGLNTGGFDWNPPTKFTGPNYMGRVDHTFNDNNGIYVRYLQSHYDTSEGAFLNARPQGFPGFGPLGEVRRNGKNLSVGYRHVFSPNLVNEFIAGFNRFAFRFTFGESNPNFGTSKLPPWSDQCVFGSFINIATPNCVSPHTARAVTTPQLVDNVSWVHGPHTIRAGINFRFYYQNACCAVWGGATRVPVRSVNWATRGGASKKTPWQVTSPQPCARQRAGAPIGTRPAWRPRSSQSASGATAAPPCRCEAAF